MSGTVGGHRAVEFGDGFFPVLAVEGDKFEARIVWIYTIKALNVDIDHIRR
jgi:L-arabinose isomerase